MITTIIIHVANAYTSGDTPLLVIPITFIGNVIYPGPLVKLLIVTSSIDNVNAINAPDFIPGKIIGNVILKNVSIFPAPKSREASSNDKSKDESEALTLNITYGIQNVVCAIARVINPPGILKTENIANSSLINELI